MSASLRVALSLLVIALTGCSGPGSSSPSEDDRGRWAELGLVVPLHRTPVFYDADGKPLPEVDLDRLREGFVFVPAAGDAGSFRLGAWYRVEAGKAERLPGEPEVILSGRLGSPEFRGLTRKECGQVRAALDASTDALFASHLEALVASGDRRSVLVLTYVMVELPWVPELAPRDGSDRRMRKLKVEDALDDLVASTEHDGLSALYFRSLDLDRSDRPDLEEAESDLIDWTLKNLDRFAWDAGAKRFQVAAPR